MDLLFCVSLEKCMCYPWECFTSVVWLRFITFIISKAIAVAHPVSVLRHLHVSRSLCITTHHASIIAPPKWCCHYQVCVKLL